MADENATKPPPLRAILLVKPNTISREDIQRADTEGGICIIECAEPDDVRFLEPPLTADVGTQARVAFTLLRRISTTGGTRDMLSRDEIMRCWLDALLSEPPPPLPPRVSRVKTK